MDARLIYPGVLRNDAEPLYGAHFIISQPPKADNVSYLCARAGHYGEERQEIMPRIEAYSVPTIESPMTLMGNQLRGSRMVQAYQRPEQTLPVVGQRYCLKSATAQQYMRVMDVQHEVRTFETPEGKEFQRRVVKMEISDALVHDFPGVAYPSPTYANPPSQLLETQVADTASYYGVRPLAAPITAQSGMIQVDQIYEKLVPTSIIETAFADQFPTGAGVWIPTAPRRRMAQIAGSYSGDIYLESSVQPGTVELPGYTDDGQTTPTAWVPTCTATMPTAAPKPPHSSTRSTPTCPCAEPPARPP